MVENLFDCFRRDTRRRSPLYRSGFCLCRDQRTPYGAEISRLEKARRPQIVSRLTARHPSRAAYISICPTLEEELNSGSPLADVIFAEVLNTLADLEDKEERRGGGCRFCSDFAPGGMNIRIKRTGNSNVSFSCKYCPICGRELI